MLQTFIDVNKSEMNFILCEKLIYYKKDDNFCFCVSAAFKKKIFKITHDDNMYEKHNKSL